MWIPLVNQSVCTSKEPANESNKVWNTDLENYSPGHRTFQAGAAAQCPLVVYKGGAVSEHMGKQY